MCFAVKSKFGEENYVDMDGGGLTCEEHGMFVLLSYFLQFYVVLETLGAS